MPKNKLYRLLGLCALVLVLIIYLVSRSGKSNTPESSAPQNSNTSTSATQASAPTSSLPAKARVISKPSVAAGQTASEAYLNALNIYQKSGYYMQFFQCQASPGSMVLKKGSKIMLDNRDSVTHLIGIRSVRYNIGSFNFAIATLDSLGTNYVTCDGGGSAQITVVP
ncbi:MAG: hypothetical protein AAB467_00025 [Patescibacteria group bacterium]